MIEIVLEPVEIDLVRIDRPVTARAGFISEVSVFVRRACEDALARLIPFRAAVFGDVALNAAGDRTFARYDFWSITQENGAYTWKKVGSYSTDPETGKGIITRTG